MQRPRPPLTHRLGLTVLSALALSLACGKSSEPKATPAAKTPPAPAPAPAPAPDESGETGDALSGEKAHVIPFADRTSMGYLLLLPPSAEVPEAPTRTELEAMVQQALPERRKDGQLDLLFRLIQTEPHTTDIAFNGELEVPELDDDPGTEGEADDNEGEAKDEAISAAELEARAEKAERERAFDLIGLHIERIHLGLGEDAQIPASVLTDPVLTRDLSPEQRASLPSRRWGLLLRADYRNQHGVRGLRLHQTLVRIAAEHYGALIHDPDTLETMDLETFTDRRLRAAAGNVADQIAIVPFPDPDDDERLRLSTRGMRRFGSVDLELAGLPRDPARLQQATDFIAGLAYLLAREAEVDITGYAVEVPDIIEVDCGSIRQSYSGQTDYEPRCSGSAEVHLVERPPEPHDPREHVVARIVAPRRQSERPDYDHAQWVTQTLADVFSAPPGPRGLAPTAEH